MRMSVQCIITVKGDGKGRYGKPKNDRIGPLSDFLVFNQIFFKVVRDHLKTCNICDPYEVIEVYLERLRKVGTVSSRFSSKSSIKGMFALEKVLRGKYGLSFRYRSMNEFWLRSQAVDDILLRAPLCTLKELVMCLQFQEVSTIDILCNQNMTFAALRQVLRNNGQFPSEEELAELVSIAEVMLS